MLQGAIENGKIFYSDSGRGSGLFLARGGLDVYAGDWRGRGESWPHINRHVYDHIPMLTHREVEWDPFPAVAEWCSEPGQVK